MIFILVSDGLLDKVVDQRRSSKDEPHGCEDVSFPHDMFVQGRGAGRQPGPEPQALQDSQCLGGL